MITLTEQIDKIIACRKQNIRDIDDKYQFILDLENRVSQLRDFLAEVRRQNENQTGSYYQLITKEPIFYSSIQDISLSNLRSKIELQKEALKLLKKRFERGYIQIALFGYARQGKSLFLQKVTGLGDDVIPTSSDTDCTGAISVIENIEGDEFSMDVEFYAEEEFIDAVNSSLEFLYGNKKYNIKELGDIPNLDLPEDQLLIRQDIKEDNIKFDLLETLKHDIIKGYGQYIALIGNSSTNYTNKKDVIELVAKYITFKKEETVPSRYNAAPYWMEDRVFERKVFLCKFVAVKTARIKYRFEHPDAGKIVLVDTIGLGNLLTHEQDKDKLLEVLREECDAAIFLNLVSTLGAPKIDKRVVDLLQEIYDDLNSHNPEKWIVGVLNRDANGDEIYHQRVRDRVKDYSRHKGLGVAWWTDVNVMDRDEVNTKVVEPLLETITDNICDIDEAFKINSDEMGLDLYREYNKICDQIQTTVKTLVSSGAGVSSIIRREFNELPLQASLIEYATQLRVLVDQKCDMILEDISVYISKITNLVPHAEDIEKEFYKMGHGMANMSVIYVNSINQTRANILSDVKYVCTKSVDQLLADVKNRVISIMFNDGLLGELPLQDNIERIPSLLWFNAFYCEWLNEYPTLRSAFESLYEFKTRIEGFIYSKFICACDVLMSDNSTPPQGSAAMSSKDKAQAIWQQIYLLVNNLKRDLKVEFGLSDGAYSAIATNLTDVKRPNVLMWCMVDTFKQEILAGKGLEELQDFYDNNGTIIWRDKIIEMQGVSNAANKWNEVTKQLIINCRSDKFRLISK